MKQGTKNLLILGGLGIAAYVLYNLFKSEDLGGYGGGGGGGSADQASQPTITPIISGGSTTTPTPTTQPRIVITPIGTMNLGKAIVTGWYQPMRPAPAQEVFDVFSKFARAKRLTTAEYIVKSKGASIKRPPSGQKTYEIFQKFTKYKPMVKTPMQKSQLTYFIKR